jgi:hypothetical protein
MLARGDPPFFTQTFDQFMEGKEFEKKRQHKNEPRDPSVISVRSSESERERKRPRMSRSPSVEIIGKHSTDTLIMTTD